MPRYIVYPCSGSYGKFLGCNHKCISRKFRGTSNDHGKSNIVLYSQKSDVDLHKEYNDRSSKTLLATTTHCCCRYCHTNTAQKRKDCSGGVSATHQERYPLIRFDCLDTCTHPTRPATTETMQSWRLHHQTMERSLHNVIKFI